MRRVHPLWRGFWLACVLTAALVLLGGPDEIAVFRGDRAALILSGATALGALLASVPGRLRQRGQSLPPLRRTVCLRAFLCGACMILALAAAGSGRVLYALYEGSAGAYAFAASALLSGFITARLTGRRTSA
ncbi:MAG: hypothetical protein IJ343_09955 [Clostridia bacterium]|nr:hypothetical protein [Clostridia bacterium]